MFWFYPFMGSLLFFLQFSLIFSNEKKLPIPYLNLNDLKSDSTFLIFHFIKRQGIFCPLCQVIETKLPELNIKTYKLNVFEQEKLSIQFLRLRYPAFTLYDSGKFYRLDFDTFKELKTCINERKWQEQPQIYPMKPLKRIIASFLSPFLKIFVLVLEKVPQVPTWLITLIFGFVFIYLCFNIFEIFTLS
ncbi:hypothetical protein M153_12890000116 [Pseudoloma neurophilia]|uniref:Thioredoxin domain-containing protein n=1 Tax=Pseudoloma neurophilia TaxID=146866 RepID=A0A0R0LRC7_9MICR|nr:hypothetical protein M153_12890000116 [Pseudoloma neurophilia]